MDNYAVVFDVENIPEFILPVIKKDYVRAYNEIVDTVNPLIDGWNELYDQKFGSPVDGNYDNDHYNGFMRDMEQSVINSKEWSKFLTFTTDEHLCKVGHMRIGNGTIKFHLEKK